MIWIDRNHPYFYFVSVSQCKARLACIPTCSCVFISTRKMYLYFPGWPHALVGKQQRRHKERLASGHCSSADRHLFVKQSNIMAIEISHKYKYIYKGVIRNIRQHCGWFWDYHHQWGDRTIYLAWCSTWLVLHIASWNCVFSSFNNPIVSLVIFVTAQRLSLSWRRGRDRERGLLQSKPLSV